MMPVCLKCEAPLCPAVRSGESDDNIFWCSRCSQTYERKNKRPTLPRFVRIPQNLAEPSTLRFEGHVKPDGAISFSCDGVGSVQEARAAGHALLHLAHRAEERLEQLAGTNRWTFQRRGEHFAASIHRESCVLVAWTSGGRRARARSGYVPPDQTCDACRKPLPKGAAGYRADEERARLLYSRISWRHLRFCSACVERAPAVAARPALTVVAGGKAASR